MTHLVAALLQQNPEKRPKINQVLNYPILWDKVGGLLQNEAFKHEFSLTTKDNKVFQMRKEQAGNTQLHEDIIQNFIGSYEPEKQSQEDFNEQYVNYVANLNNLGEIKEPELDASSYVFEVNYDHNSSQFDGPSVDEDSTYNYTDSKNSTLIKSLKGGSFNQNDFVNVASLDWTGFSQFMIKQYGDIQFTDGFKIIEDNYQALIDEDDCEDQLAALIEDLNFDSPEMLKMFVSNSINYKFA